MPLASSICRCPQSMPTGCSRSLPMPTHNAGGDAQYLANAVAHASLFTGESTLEGRTNNACGTVLPDLGTTTQLVHNYVYGLRYGRLHRRTRHFRHSKRVHHLVSATSATYTEQYPILLNQTPCTPPIDRRLILTRHLDSEQVARRQHECRCYPRIYYCVGYISGVRQMMLQPDDSAIKGICAGSIGVSVGAMVQAFKVWARQNPTHWDKPALIGFVVALSTTWPCSQPVNAIPQHRGSRATGGLFHSSRRLARRTYSQWWIVGSL
jgi:hypothetical protein